MSLFFGKCVLKYPSVKEHSLCLQFTLKQFKKKFTSMYVLKYTGKMTLHNKRLTCRGS